MMNESTRSAIATKTYSDMSPQKGDAGTKAGIVLFDPDGSEAYRLEVTVVKTVLSFGPSS